MKWDRNSRIAFTTNNWTFGLFFQVSLTIDEYEYFPTLLRWVLGSLFGTEIDFDVGMNIDEHTHFSCTWVLILTLRLEQGIYKFTYK